MYAQSFSIVVAYAHAAQFIDPGLPLLRNIVCVSCVRARWCASASRSCTNVR